MSITIATGTKINCAKTYGPALVISSISNASPAVAVFADASSVVVGDYLEITSGWGLLDKRIVRVSAKSTNNVTLEGIDTSSTQKYSGSGSGSARRITAWEQLSQIKSMSPSGGDPKFSDISTMDDLTDKQVPVGRNASSQEFVLFFDPTLAWHTTVTAVTESLTLAGMMMVFPNGSRTLANAYWSLSRNPEAVKDEGITVKLSLSYASDAIVYPT